MAIRLGAISGLFLDSRWTLGRLLKKIERGTGPGRGKKKGAVRVGKEGEYDVDAAGTSV